MKGSHDGAVRAVAMKNGKVSGLLEIVKTPSSILTNPAAMANLSALMSQYAMQQSLDEIHDYLEQIDEKVSDVLQAQKDSVFSELLAVGAEIDEAFHVRRNVGRVSQVTWSKIQNSSAVIAQVQAYALLQLDGLAEKLERKAKIGELVRIVQQVEEDSAQWLVVLARCFELKESLGIIELDRVLDSVPEDLESHRVGLQIARAKRAEHIMSSTDGLLLRIRAIAEGANRKVLMHPKSAREIVEASKVATNGLHQLRSCIGIDTDNSTVDAKAWKRAVGEIRDRVLDAGADGVGAVKQLGEETRDRALDKAESVAGSLSESLRQRRESKADAEKSIED